MPVGPKKFKSPYLEECAERMLDLMSKVIWFGDMPHTLPFQPYTAKHISRWARFRRWIEAHRPYIHGGPCEQEYNYDED